MKKPFLSNIRIIAISCNKLIEQSSVNLLFMDSLSKCVNNLWGLENWGLNNNSTTCFDSWQSERNISLKKGSLLLHRLPFLLFFSVNCDFRHIFMHEITLDTGSKTIQNEIFPLFLEYLYPTQCRHNDISLEDSSESQWLSFCLRRPLCKHTHFRDSCSVTISCLSYNQGEGISEMKVVETGVILIYLLKYVLQFVGRWQLKLPRSLFAWRSPLFATVA